MTKFLHILIAALLFLFAFLGGYLINQTKNQKSQLISIIPGFSSESNLTQKITIPPLKLVQISNTPILSAVNPDSGFIVFIEKEGGKVVKASINTPDTKSVLSVIPDNSIKTVLSGNGQGVLLYLRTATGGYSINFKDLNSRQNYLLHPAITTAVFSPDGEKIAYHFFNKASGQGNISISSPDGSIFKNIFNTRLDSVVLHWPQKNFLSFYKNALSSEGVGLFVLDIENTRLTKILDDKTGLDITWSPTGNQLLYSFFDSQNNLRLVFKDIPNNKEIEVPFSTFASKCAFGASGNNIYCGVPSDPPQNPTKPAFSFSKEKISGWDAGTGDVWAILEISNLETIRISKPLVSFLGDYLFFTNLTDEKFYRLLLK